MRLSPVHDDAINVTMSFGDYKQLEKRIKDEAYEGVYKCLESEAKQEESSLFPGCLQKADNDFGFYVSFVANNYKNIEGYYKELVLNKSQPENIAKMHDSTLAMIDSLGSTMISNLVRHKLFEKYADHIEYDAGTLEPNANNINHALEDSIGAMFQIARRLSGDVLGHKAFIPEERDLFIDSVQIRVDNHVLKTLHDMLDKGYHSQEVARIHNSIFSNIVQNEKRGVDKCSADFKYSDFASANFLGLAETVQSDLDSSCLLNSELGLRNAYRIWDSKFSQYKEMLNAHHHKDTMGLYTDGFTIRCASLLKDSFTYEPHLTNEIVSICRDNTNVGEIFNVNEYLYDITCGNGKDCGDDLQKYLKHYLDLDLEEVVEVTGADDEAAGGQAAELPPESLVVSDEEVVEENALEEVADDIDVSSDLEVVTELTQDEV